MDRILCDRPLASKAIVYRRHKFDPEQVANIRKMRSDSASYTEIAQHFKTRDRTIRRVINKAGYYRPENQW